jgi:NADPH2:quinone reductase
MNSNKTDLLLNNGPDYVLIDDGNLSEKVKELLNNRVDKALELIGSATMKDSLQCVMQGGSVFMTGMLSEQWSIPDFAPMDSIPAAVNFAVYDSGQIRVDAQSFQQFIFEVETEQVKLPISQAFKLDNIAEAHKLMDNNAADGKLVVLT